MTTSPGPTITGMSKKNFSNVTVKIAHYFTATHSVSYTAEKSGDTASIGVSFTASPFKNNFEKNKALTELDSNKKNIVGGTRYFSLNEVFDTSLEVNLIRKSDGTVENGECASKTFVWLGYFKECLDSCPIGQSKTVKYFGDSIACQSECNTGDYTVWNEPNVCLNGSCDSIDSYLYQGDTASKICMSACEHPFPFKKGNVCVAECSDYHVADNDSLINTVNETGECIADCGNEFYFNDPELSAKWYCVDTCPLSMWSHYVEPVTGRKICMEGGCIAPEIWTGAECEDDCPPTRPYIIDTGTVLACRDYCNQYEWLSPVVTAPFLSNEIGNTGNCVIECSGFEMETDEFYPNTLISKKYCLSSCPVDKFVDSHLEKCLDSCTPTSPLKYATPSNVCVSDCQTAGFKYILPDNSCSNECSHNIFNDIFCLIDCPPESPFSLGGKCGKSCPEKIDFETLECVDNCSAFSMDHVCVSDCRDITIQFFFATHNLLYTPKPFVDPSKQCVPSCPAAIIPETGECVPNCPPCETGCEWSHLKIQDRNGFCVSNCEGEDEFQENDTCVSECSSAKPFSYENICLPDCPPERTFFITKEHSLECLSECPVTHSRLVRANNLFACVTECPPQTDWNSDSNLCETDCSSLPGSVQRGDSCFHCFKEQAQYELEGDCVDVCPSGTTFDSEYRCRACKELFLWEDDQGRCIPEKMCKPNSFKDFDRSKCSDCAANGKLLVKRGENGFSCEKSTCDGGHLETISGIEYCTICPEKQFYWNLDCNPKCNKALNYDFNTYKCVVPCSGCDCCEKGNCTGAECVCYKGYTGEYCNIEEGKASTVVENIHDFLLLELISPVLEGNVISLFEKLEYLLNFSSEEAKEDLIDNTFTHLNRLLLHPSDTYPLVILDKLIPLSFYLPDSALFKKVMDRIFSITSTIQKFNQTNENNDYKQFEGYFQGKYFSFAYGSNSDNQSQIDLSTCKTRILEHYRLPANKHLPWTILEFNSKISKSIESPSKNAFIASATPLQEAKLFLDFGEVETYRFCEKRVVDTTFSAKIVSPSQIDTLIAFNNSNINVFSKEDPFFNDKCIPHHENNKDYTLKTRRESIFISPKEVCEESAFQVCSIASYTVSGDVICKCKGTRTRKKSSLQEIFATYPSNNLGITLCWEIFAESEFYSNFGFYIVLTPILVISTAWLVSSISLYKDLECDKRFDYLRNDMSFIEENQMNLEIYFKECQNLRKTVRRARFKKITVKISKRMVNVLPSLPDYDALSTTDLLRLDTRSTAEFALDTFKSEHILLKTFFTKSLIDPKIFVLFSYLTEINLSIMLNALLIDDDMIEGAQEGENSFYAEIVTVAWATVTAKGMKIVLELIYFLDQKHQNKLLRRMNYFESSYLRRSYDHYLTKHRGRMLIFLSLVAVFNLFCFYFVVVFMEIYSNSMGLWAAGVIKGLILDNLVLQLVIPTCLVVTRLIAAKSSRFESVFDLIRQLSQLKRLDIF